jgi:hypothetical protein
LSKRPYQVLHPATENGISEWDRTHVFEIVEHGHGDWFGAQLLRLIKKADAENRERLRKGFPEAVKAFEKYEES